MKKLHRSHREALAAGILALADQFDKTVVFEGVKTGAELATVRRLGAHLLPGSHLGRPVLAAE